MESKSTLIKGLNPSETEVFKELLRDPSISATVLAKKFYRKPGSIRTNITAIYKKLKVPPDVDNKREWLVKEYGDVFKRVERETVVEPEIFIKPPAPIPVVFSKPEPIPPEPEPTKIHTPGQDRGNTGTFFVVGIIGTLILIFSIYIGIETNATRVRQEESKAPINLPTATAEIIVTQAVPTATPNFTGPVLFYDDFNTGKISPEWVVDWWISPVVTDGMMYVEKNDYTSLLAGSGDWANFAVYASIHIKGCPEQKKMDSLIIIRSSNYNPPTAYGWNPCDYSVGSVLDIVIMVIGSKFTVTENGRTVKYNGGVYVPASTGGGIRLNLYEESAIDYVGVEKLP